MANYGTLVGDLSSLLPTTAVFTTAPAPRRSAGFATRRSKAVGDALNKQTDKHFHLGVCKGFVGRRKGRFGDSEPGGRFPVNDDRFCDDGVTPDNEFLEIVIKRAYAGVTHFLNKQQVYSDYLGDVLLRF